MTGLLLELRRGPGVWAAPVLLAAGLFYAFSTVQTLTVWTYSTGAVANAPFLVGPLAAGVAAWAGGRGPRRGITDRERLSPWGPVGVATVEIAALIAWTLVAYAVVVAVLFGITATQATWGGPLWLWLGTSAVGLAAHVPVGWVAGRLIPLRFTPFTVALVAFGIAIVNDTQFYREWWSRLFLVRTWVQPPFGDVRPVPLLGQIIWYLGLSMAAVAALALATRAPWRLVALLGTATLVALGSGTAVVASSGLRFDEPARHIVWDCVGEAPLVCVHPAYAASIPELRRRAEAVAARLAGTPFAIRRAEQRPRSLFGGAPSPGAVAFAFDAPVPRHYERAASEMASSALGIADACFRPDEAPRPGRESLAMISAWAAGGTGRHVRPDAQSAWSWLTTQPVAQVQVWITAHAPAIRHCTLSLADFR